MGVSGLRTVLIASCIATIIGGVLILYFSISQLSEYTPLWEDIQFSANKYVVYALYILGGLCIILGIIGILGAVRRNGCILGLFNLLTLVFSLIFLGIGISVAIFSKNQYRNLQDQDCSSSQGDYPWLYDANQLYVSIGEVYFCQNECACYIENKQQFPLSTIQKLLTTENGTGPYQFQQCQGQAQQQQQFNEYLTLVQFLENQFECSGICTNVPYYIFTNINRGPPPYTEGCKTRLLNFFDQYGIVVECISFCVGGFFLLMVIFAVCLCCSKKQRHLRSYRDRYKRMYD